MKRANNKTIIVAVDWDSILNKPEIPDNVTFETLDANGDVGPGADQVAKGNHDHEIGEIDIYFENKLI